MFSGIVRKIGTITSIKKDEGKYFSLQSPISQRANAQKGDSLCVNGVCLTITQLTEETLEVFAAKETLAITNLDSLQIGHCVHLEPAITIKQTLDGHIVYGHVDKTLPILSIEQGKHSHIIKLTVDKKDLRYLIKKGSVCLEGVSLTVYEINDTPPHTYFSVMIIPHTYKNTTLREKKVGDRLNVEFDPIAKYVERQLSLKSSPKD